MSEKPERKRSVIQSALAMAVGTFSSRILGFIRDAVMFHLFPKAVTDAFVVAFKLPNLFRRLLGEGSLSASFIPVYADSRLKSAERAKQVSNAVFTILLALSIVISVACFVFMEQIVNFLVNDPRGYGSIPGKVEQTVYLARIMIFYLVLVSTYAFHMAIANTLGHFFVPAVGPTLFNFGLIIFTLFQFEIGAYPGSSQAWGVIFGGVLQVAVVAWLLIKIGFFPRLTFKWGGPEVRQVFLNMVPGLFGLGVYQVMMIVNIKFAARLSEGVQSYIYAADRILELPQSLIAVSLGAALLPRFSDLHASGERDKFLAEANQAVRMLLFLSLPAAVGMWILSLPITEVLFMRGKFGPEDAMQTAQIVQIYAVLMLFSSLARVTSPAFYALKNTWLPAVVAAVVLVLHIFVGGYMVATSASSILNIVILQICFRFMIGPLGYGSIFVSVLRMVPALAALGAFGYYVYPVLFEFMGRTPALFLVILAGMALYFGVGILTGSEAAVKVTGVLSRRLKRKRA
jgi:putative peptidoglycan lipid II flippase